MFHSMYPQSYLRESDEIRVIAEDDDTYSPGPLPEVRRDFKGIIGSRTSLTLNFPPCRNSGHSKRIWRPYLCRLLILEWRDLKRAQEASEDIISNLKSQIFMTKDLVRWIKIGRELVSDVEIVKFPTQPATTEKSSEDGGNLEELILTSAADKGDFTGPILAVKEDLGHNLIYLHIWYMVDDDGKISKLA
ncbi:hypothetical protein Tco_1124761 [Tanacetum coccineum]|uniref:Uncharacterized protein n=1 Tax=Tanacetum coccineum TaxID=301880 RepID=A0ABQ5J875_9ASTR